MTGTVRRVVGRVRIVEMNPRKKRTLGGSLDPCQRAIDAVGCTPLDVVHTRFAVAWRDRSRRIGVESLVEAPSRIQDERSDKGGGPIAGFTQPLRDDQSCVDVEPAVVSHTVLVGNRPVSSDMCAGSVRRRNSGGLVKRSPRAASASSVGVAAAVYP